MRNKIIWLFTLVFLTSLATAQIQTDATGLSRGVSRLPLQPLQPLQSPTPPDNRGLGVKGGGPNGTTSSDQRSREAKPELVLQTGYNNFYGATRLVFSPDGKLLATATMRSNTVSLWETATNRKLRDLSTSGQSTPHFAPSVAFSRDSRFIATASGDNTVTVWDVISGRELQKLTGSQGTMMASMGVYFLAFTPDNRLVTVSDALRVWDVSSGRELHKQDLGTEVMSGFNGTEGSMTLSPDGSQLLLLNEGSAPEINFIDLNSGREVRRVKVSGDQIEGLQLSFNSEGHLLAAGVHDKRFKFWDLTAKQDKELGPTSKDYPQIRFSRDGRLLALSDSYNVRIWETATLRELPALKVPNSGAFSEYGDAMINFSEDGKRIATGGFDTDTIVWETETGKRLSNLNGRTNMAYNVAFSADGNELFSGGRTRWDLRTGRGIRITPDTPGKTYGIVSPDGRTVAVMKPNSNVLSIVESPSGKQLQSLTSSDAVGIVERSRFNSDGTILAVVYGPREDQRPSPTSLTRGSQVKLWDVKSGRELHSLVTSDAPMDVDFTLDSKQLVTIGVTGQI